MDDRYIRALVKYFQKGQGLAVDGVFGPATERSLGRWRTREGERKLTWEGGGRFGTKNFSLDEFSCKDGAEVPEHMRDDTLELMHNLEALRTELDGAAIMVISGYRTPSYNRKVGGAASSKHMLGIAADIKVVGVSPALVADTIEALISAGRMLEGGLGRYPTFTHYDVRGTRARWGSDQ